jgi:TfoX/Sxy family transcriptional regulator of competence genes
MTMPKPSEQAKAAFQKLVPPDPNVTTRPMFGNLAGFVNGNMFCGLFGEDLFVRVSSDDQARVRKQGGRAFEPMPGRAMTGYVVVAAGWQKKPDATRAWIVTALSWSRALPAKAPKTAKKKPPTLTLPRKGGGKLRGKS